jgi:hypothetical protein
MVYKMLRYVSCCIKHDHMARPRGRTKTARLTVNLEPREYDDLCALAREQDVPLAWLIRRAVSAFLASRTVGGPPDASKPDRSLSPFPGAPR